MLRILVPPSGTAASFSCVKGEPIVFSFQDCNSAGTPYSLANRQLYWATYVTGAEGEIQYYKANITQNAKGDIALFVLPGTHSMSLYKAYGSAKINADLFEALDDGNSIILQSTLTIEDGPPRIVDDNAAPLARYIQNVSRKNDPETLDKPKFEVSMAAYVPAGATAPVPNPAINLGSLALSVATATAATPYSGSITGATSGSTLSVSNLPAGLTLNSSTRTITGTPTTAGTASFTLVETLSGATNSPKINGVTLTVASAAPTPAPSAWSLDRSNFTYDATNWSWDRIDGNGVVPSTVAAITLALSAAQSVAEGNPATAAAITLALSNAQAVAEGNPASSLTLALSGAKAVAEGT